MMQTRVIYRRRRIAIDARLALFFVIVLVGLLALTTGENYPVVAPILAVAGGSMCFVLVLLLWQRDIPFAEVGLVYVAVVALYAVYPMLGYLVNGLTYSPFNDVRLSSAQPTPMEVGRIGWFYVAHLLSFMMVYLGVRGRAAVRRSAVESPGRSTILALLFLYLSINMSLLFVDRLYGLSKYTYMESYLNLGRLPPGLAQIVFLLTGARFTMELSLLAVFFCYYRKYRTLAWTWLAWVTATTFVRLGNRTDLVLLLIAFALLYHKLVRPLALRTVAVGGLLVLLMFVVLGILRTGWISSDSPLVLNPFAYASEFEVIFGNAYHLYQVTAARGTADLPRGFYLSDLLIHVPHQLIPFQKTIPAEWYVSTYYPEYAAQGGGLAFGTISESVLGGGWLDAAMRGAALGILLALIHRYYVRHRTAFWVVVFYVWLDTQMYQSVRNTTFFPLYLFVYRFLWVVLVVKLLTATISLIPRRQRTDLKAAME